jgi:hypothetical protein
MQKTLRILAVLLAAQLVLAVAMSFTGPNLAAVRPDTALISLDDRKVDRIVMAGPDKQQLVLAKQGDSWVLPGTAGFPADAAKVRHLLDRLTGLKRGFAVATTKGAQTRFKVSDSDFERRVLLEQGDKPLATIYFGTSPGLRRVHARSAGDDAVYTADFGLYEAPLKASDWEDKSVLHLNAGEIDGIEVGGFTITRAPAQPAGETGKHHGKTAATDAVWHGQGLAENESLQQSNVAALAEKIAGLDIDSVLGTEAQPGYGLDKPALVLRVQRKDGGKTLEYRLGKREQQHDYVLKVSGRPEYFRLPAHTGDALVKAAVRKQLVMAHAARDNTQAGGSPGAAAPAADAAEPERHAAKEGDL